MKKIKYTEPDSYFPKAIRDKIMGKSDSEKSTVKRTVKRTKTTKK